jgi:hypothetical protein
VATQIGIYDASGVARASMDDVAAVGRNLSSGSKRGTHEEGDKMRGLDHGSGIRKKSATISWFPGDIWGSTHLIPAYKTVHRGLFRISG